MSDEPILIADAPAPFVRRLTLNRPAKRDALSNALRGALFEALEAWAAEKDCPRGPDQTPHEFAHSIAGRKRSLRELAANLADLYCEAAYAPGRLRVADMQPLQELWRTLHVPQVAPARQISP